MQYRRSRLAGVAALVAALGVGACEKQVREAKGEPDGTATERSGAVATVNNASLAPAPASQAREPAASAAVGLPASATVAETRPAAVLSFLTVDGVNVQFPPTKLLLHEHDGGRRITAELFSDLPKSALRNYAGNDLYLEMDLAGAAAGKVEGATWRFKSERSDKADTANGIFLNGQAMHLQPFDVWVRFVRGDEKAGVADAGSPDVPSAGGDAEAPLMCELIGQFRAYEAGTPDALAPSVGVSGALPVEIVKKR